MVNGGGTPTLLPAVLRFGVFEFDRRRRELRKRGNTIKLQGQHYEVLSVLLEEPGRLVTREDLRRRVWPDGRFVEFDKAINKAICGLRRILGDSAVSPRFIDTVPGQGHRFVAPTQAWSSSAATGATFPGLMVLPIENLSGDSGKEYIADAATDILISALGQIARLRVISRTSAMSYKGVRKSLPQIAAELCVGFAVEGSFTRSVPGFASVSVFTRPAPNDNCGTGVTKAESADSAQSSVS